MPAMVQQNDARWMTPRDLVDGHCLDRRAKVDVVRRGTITKHDQIRHQGVCNRTIASGIAPEERELIIHRARRTVARHAIGHGFLHLRPAATMSRSASDGPHSPAG